MSARRLTVSAFIALGLATVWILAAQPPTAVPDVAAVPPPPVEGPVPVVLAAGDIARCEADADERVAALVKARAGVVLTLGDHAYTAGTSEEFEECYDPSWGELKQRTRPVPGNHEYKTFGAEPYFEYFGRNAGQPAVGYYAYDLGTHWRAIALNSNCEHIAGGCDENMFDLRESAQVAWLKRELARNADKNILAYWHHATFSSGYHGSGDEGSEFWEVLHAAGADIVLVAHEHHYERFAPLDGEGDIDHEQGMRQFVVGTGGGALRPFTDPPLAGTEVRNADVHGALRLELHPSSYRWEFLSVQGSSFSDEGIEDVRGHDDPA